MELKNNNNKKHFLYTDNLCCFILCLYFSWLYSSFSDLFIFNLRSTFKKADVLNSFASQVYVLESSRLQSLMISFLMRPSATISYFLVLRISCPSLNHFRSAFSLDSSHSRMAVASSSTVWSSKGLVNSTGGSVICNVVMWNPEQLFILYIYIYRFYLIGIQVLLQ